MNGRAATARTIRVWDREHQMNISLRRAQATDAEEAAAVLRASISTLCVADHYRAAGYVDAADPHVENGFELYPMVKDF